MRNRLLSISKNFIPYLKELRPYCHSVTSCILMQYLDYMFEREPDGFCMFMKPCNHPLYKQGLSWTELLSFSPSEFTTAFDNIGFRYISLKEYNGSSNKFQGKFYLSYTIRTQGVTIYKRNHEMVDSFLATLIQGNSYDFVTTSKNNDTVVTEARPHHLEDEIIDLRKLETLISTNKESEIIEKEKLNQVNGDIDLPEVNKGIYGSAGNENGQKGKGSSGKKKGSIPFNSYVKNDKKNREREYTAPPRDVYSIRKEIESHFIEHQGKFVSMDKALFESARFINDLAVRHKMAKSEQQEKLLGAWKELANEHIVRTTNSIYVVETIKKRHKLR